jgi:hypothetical protein
MYVWAAVVNSIKWDLIYLQVHIVMAWTYIKYGWYTESISISKSCWYVWVFLVKCDILFTCDLIETKCHLSSRLSIFKKIFYERLKYKMATVTWTKTKLEIGILDFSVDKAFWNLQNYSQFYTTVNVAHRNSLLFYLACIHWCSHIIRKILCLNSPVPLVEIKPHIINQWNKIGYLFHTCTVY